MALPNKVYMALGGSEPLNWIAQYPFVIIIAATLLTSIAYGTTVFSSAVKSIPENQFRAARVDGAGEWEIVRNIILPNLRFHITFIALWETLGLLTNYVTIMLITNGGPGVQTEVWALSGLPQGLLGQPVRLWCCHFAGADCGGYGADACDRRCGAPSGKIPFLRNQEVRYEIFPETQV